MNGLDSITDVSWRYMINLPVAEIIHSFIHMLWENININSARDVLVSGNNNSL